MSRGSSGAPSWWPRTSPSSSLISTPCWPCRRGRGSRSWARREQDPQSDRTHTGAGTRGPLRRVLAEPGTPYGRLALAGLLGLAAAAATIGLLAGSGYVVGRAALRPGLSALVGILAVVEVLAFLRGPLRYAERLVGHDAALRALTRWRLWLYDCLSPRVPAALAGWRSGDLLARAIDDVDALQDLYLRTLLPVAIAAGAAVIGTVAVGLILPWAALALGLPLLVALIVPALLTWRRGGDEEVAALAGTLSAQVVDALAGAPELLAFGAEGRLVHAVEELGDPLRRARGSPRPHRRRRRRCSCRCAWPSP